MTSIVMLYELNSTPEARAADFWKLLADTARFKGLSATSVAVFGQDCTAAKLDGAVSHCRGAVYDDATGSWLMAAGAPVYMGADPAGGHLPGLLRAYIKYGRRALDDWDGHFALAIYSGLDQSLAVVSDPMGMFAIYRVQRGQRVLVSTSALALARLCAAPPDALVGEIFLRTGRMYGEKTLWQAVKRARPARILRLKAGVIDEQEYWSPQRDERVARLPMAEALEQADALIQEVYRRAIPAGERMIWADLTGGFDSRLTSLYLAKMGIPFMAYCVGPRQHPDVRISAQAARAMGWDYQPMALPEDWDARQVEWIAPAVERADGGLPIGELAGALYGYMQRGLRSREHVTGAGVDEWRYHNYGTHILNPASGASLDYDTILDTRIMGPVPLRALRADRTMEARAELKRHLAELCAAYGACDLWTQTDILFRRHRHPIHSGAYLSAEVPAMQAVMPFCFRPLVNFGMSINGRWRMKYSFAFVRALIEKGSPRLAALPTTYGGPAEPMRWSNLHRFMPLWGKLARRGLDKAGISRLGGKFERRVAPLKDQGAPDPVQHGYLRWARDEKLLAPGAMYSGALYAPLELEALVQAGLNGSSLAGDFLDRVITIEMALRLAGVGLG